MSICLKCLNSFYGGGGGGDGGGGEVASCPGQGILPPTSPHPVLRKTGNSKGIFNFLK